MKVVFDTNVYVAEALDGDTARRIIASTDRASWRVYISRYVVDEMSAVMTEDLGLSRRSAALAAIRALRRARLVEPIASRHTVPQDAADSEVLRNTAAFSRPRGCSSKMARVRSSVAKRRVLQSTAEDVILTLRGVSDRNSGQRLALRPHGPLPPTV